MFRRLLAALLLVAVAGALLVLAWPQLFSLQRSALVAQLVSFRAAAATGALVALLLLLVLALANPAFRRLGASLAVIALAFVLVSAVVLASRGFGGSAMAATGPSGITVVSWNTLGGAPGARAIASLAIDSDADIVSLPETTKKTADAVAALMTAAGLPTTAHTVAFGHISKSRSTSVLISTALGAYHLDGAAGSTSTLPSLVMVPDDGTGPTIVAVHAVAPLPSEFAYWNSDLRWLARACGGGDTIMTGDFNATLDHFVGLGAGPGQTLGRCTDAAVRAHSSAVGTWPAAAPAALGAQIDHVMTTKNWRVAGMRVIETLDGAGSDHRPILVRLRPMS
jgi:endonuclease/exonuclease/phosphatase (EEP) superfamily protein YafD